MDWPRDTEKGQKFRPDKMYGEQKKCKKALAGDKEKEPRVGSMGKARFCTRGETLIRLSFPDLFSLEV